MIARHVEAMRSEADALAAGISQIGSHFGPHATAGAVHHNRYGSPDGVRCRLAADRGGGNHGGAADARGMGPLRPGPRDRRGCAPRAADLASVRPDGPETTRSDAAGAVANRVERAVSVSRRAPRIRTGDHTVRRQVVSGASNRDREGTSIPGNPPDKAPGADVPGALQ